MTKISWHDERWWVDLGKSNVQIANVSRFNNKLSMMIFFLCHNKQHLGKNNRESWIMICFAIGCKGCYDKQSETKEVIYKKGCGNKCEYWQDLSQWWSNQGMHEVRQNIYILSRYYQKI